MLVNMNEVLYPAKEGRYGVGLFNAVNMELARGIIEAAEETKSPVIFGTAEVLFPYGPLEMITGFLTELAKNASVPVVLHLDHGLHKETCIKALEMGFTSIMYDCSTDPYEENVRKVAEMAEIAHSYGATIEAELGHVGNNEGSDVQDDPSAFYTDPEQAKDFVSRTNVDALAIAVGTAHGAYKLPPKLDFGRIEEIAAAIDIPLVLHGGSGLTDEDFRHAIRSGISKVNIFTDLNAAGEEAAVHARHGATGLTDLVLPEIAAIKKATIEKLELFGCVGKAKQRKVVAAGHICLDVTPEFRNAATGQIGDLLRPGTLVEMGAADVHIGGSTANTGLAMKVLGADVELMGKIGKDSFGTIIKEQVGQYVSTEYMIEEEGENSSYSIVIAPKGFDRMFLHCPGANDTFSSKDPDYDVIREATLFHFGYPPLMKAMFRNDGEELIRMFRKVKAMGVATSLDTASVDENSEAGQADWEKILKGVLRYVDFFVPSAEELAYMIDRPLFREWSRRAGSGSLTDVIRLDEIRGLAETLLSWGAKVVLIKCGAPGLYLATGSQEDMDVLGTVLEMDMSGWENVRHFEKSFRPEKVLSATGAGDTTIAAFLYAVLHEHSWQESVSFAAATGACCVETYDALSGLQRFSKLRRRIEAGWEKQDLL